MAASTESQQLPPPPPLRLLAIPPGTLLGFKACPGPDGARILNHAATAPGDASAWSGIYVQLSLAQAVAYVPNQYDRGEVACGICRITTRRTLHVAVSDDPAMARAEISSANKARRVLLSVQHTPELDWEIPSIANHDELAIVAYFGKHDHCLCLVDCENYELAIPHSLFASDNLDLDPILVLQRSTAIPGGVIGRMEFLPNVGDDSNGNEERNRFRAAHQLLPSLRASELADASSLGPMLEERFETHQLMDAVRAKWFLPPGK